MTNGTVLPGRASVQEQLADLRFSVESKRITWTCPVSDALFGAGLTLPVAEEWAELPWYGPLELWSGPNTEVSDIHINGPEREVQIVERGVRTNTGVRLHADWITWLQQQLLLRTGYATPDHPDDWRDIDGRPVHALYGTAERRLRWAITRPPYSRDGATVNVRILPARWRTLDDLCHQDSGVMTREMAELLLGAIRLGASILVVGSTGSGKTTLTAALLQAVAQEKRAIIIEDASELPTPPDGHCVEVLRSRATFSDCVRLTLRQRPDLIVVGEVRGPEALAMLEAGATGHPGICTIHGADCMAGLRNLERFACKEGVAPGTVRGMITSGAVPLVVVHIGSSHGRRWVGAIIETTRGAPGQAGEQYPNNTLVEYELTGRVKRYPVQSEWGKGRL